MRKVLAFIVCIISIAIAYANDAQSYNPVDEKADLSALSKEVEKRVNEIYNHVFTEYVKLWNTYKVPNVDTFDSLY